MKAFAIPLRSEPWPKGKHEARPCPVCGRSWTPWADSRLPCHGKCLFSPADREILKTDPRTDAELARHYGVTPSIIRATRSTRSW